MIIEKNTIYVNISNMDQEEKHLTKKEERELRRLVKEENRLSAERVEKIKKILIWIIVLFSILGTVVGFVKLFTAGGGLTSQTVNITVDASDWQKGNKESKVVLVEYSDFQCPACAFYHEDVKKILGEFGDKINFVYRHYPLIQIHKSAYLAAQLAEAAGMQGKFWEIHDQLFETQNSWSKENNPKDTFMVIVDKFGLNKKKMEEDINQSAVKNKIDNNIKSGDEYGVNATPTFFLNGNKLKDINSFEDFRNIIKQEIEKTSAK